MSACVNISSTKKSRSATTCSPEASPAAVVLVDAVVRLQPGALGSAESTVEESFADGLLEYPQYTRPPEFRGWRVPDILLSGDHGAVHRWRREQQIERTRQRRPDLLDQSDDVSRGNLMSASASLVSASPKATCWPKLS